MRLQGWASPPNHMKGVNRTWLAYGISPALQSRTASALSRDPTCSFSRLVMSHKLCLMFYKSLGPFGGRREVIGARHGAIS